MTQNESETSSSAVGDAPSGTPHDAPVETVEPEPIHETASDPNAGTASESSAGAPDHDGGGTEADAGRTEAGGGGSEAETEDADAEGHEASDSSAPEGQAKKKRRRRRKKKEGEPHAHESAPPRPHRASDRAPFHVGEEVFGKVTAVIDAAVMVDLSGKALGIFDRSEMEPDDLLPSVGDRFVARVHNDGARGGLVVLTRKPLREEESKAGVEQAAKENTPILGLITGVIKGGVEVDIGGLRAFAPASGLDLHPANANFAAFVGQRMDFKVVQYDKNGRDIVVTRRPMLEAEAHERRKHALGLLSEGQVLKGVVRTVVEWGIFVALPDAENLEGLVHVSEASHDPRPKLVELAKPGDKFDVKIIKIDERGKIWLSRKALIEDPWGQAREKYAQGTRHTGKVERLEPFGAFVSLEPGVDGLIHISDLSFNRIEHPNEILEVGQEIEVVVHHFDLRSKKLSLHPAPKPEHANEQPQKVVRNAAIKAEVVRGEPGGVIVRVLGATGRAARGYIPAGHTGTARGTDLRKHFKPGSVLDLKVMDVDPRRGEPTLSIRGLKEDEERRAHKEYRDKLKAESSFGTLGDLLRAKFGAAGPSVRSTTPADESGEEQK